MDEMGEPREPLQSSFLRAARNAMNRKVGTNEDERD